MVPFSSLKQRVRDFAGQKPNAPQTGRSFLLHERVWPRISSTTRLTTTNETSKERVEVYPMFYRKFITHMHRVAARHEFPFRLSNMPKRTGNLLGTRSLALELRLHGGTCLEGRGGS